MDLAGQQYWEKTWQDRKVIGAINLKNYTQSRLDFIFNQYLPRKEGVKLMEAGCAQSSWLPYFYLRFGYEVSGIDYSETGCEKAKQNLLNYNVQGTILCRNFFDENQDLFQQSDIVFSRGVIEHFEKPEIVLEKFHNLLKPDGIIVTIIPNMAGLMGRLQKMVNRPVYDLHIPMNLNELKDFHAQAGFTEIFSSYIGSVGTEVVNYPADGGLKIKLLRRFLKRLSKGAWSVFRLFNYHPESLTFSPYIIFIGRKIA